MEWDERRRKKEIRNSGRIIRIWINPVRRRTDVPYNFDDGTGRKTYIEKSRRWSVPSPEISFCIFWFASKRYRATITRTWQWRRAIWTYTNGFRSVRSRYVCIFFFVVLFCIVAHLYTRVPFQFVWLPCIMIVAYVQIYCCCSSATRIYVDENSRFRRHI